MLRQAQLYFNFDLTTGNPSAYALDELIDLVDLDEYSVQGESIVESAVSQKFFYGVSHESLADSRRGAGDCWCGYWVWSAFHVNLVALLSDQRS